MNYIQHLWIVFSELEATEIYSAACSWNTIDPNPNARWVQTQENKWEDAVIYGLAFGDVCLEGLYGCCDRINVSCGNGEMD